MTKVAVLSGGNSDEREVSLRSGLAVVAALTSTGYTVVQLDSAHQDAEFEYEIDKCDVVFPALHGQGGEDGTIQSWLESKNKTFVGAGSEVSEICFDKWRYKQKLRAADIPTPEGQLVDEASLWQSPLVQNPFVLKPFNGGSSVDTFVVRDPKSYDRTAITATFQRHPQMLIENLIEGKEITVAILGNEVLPVIEIVPPSGGEFDYDNKYNGKTQELCPPVSVPANIQENAQNLALKIHNLLGVRDLSRTDMMIDQAGNLFVLETNTIPGLTDQSLLPKAAAAQGYDMPTLCSMLVEAAIKRINP